MGSVSELANEQLNPVDGDLVEISHETYTGSGVWGSFKMTLLTLRTWILSFVYGFKITKIVITGSDGYTETEYAPARFESIEKIILKNGGENNSLFIKDYLGNVIYPETSGSVHPVGMYDETVNEGERTLSLWTSLDCTIVIISNTNI